MKTLTREIIQMALRGDGTAQAPVVEEIMALVDGKTAQPPAGPLLLNMKQAACLLGVSKTWFWEQVRADCNRDKKFFPPVEINPGAYRYRREDIEAFAANVTTYAPRRRKQKVIKYDARN